MSRVFISGWGAVSPAGWGTAPLREALERGIPLAAQALARPGWTNPLRVREVPAPQPRRARAIVEPNKKIVDEFTDR